MREKCAVGFISRKIYFGEWMDGRRRVKSGFGVFGGEKSNRVGRGGWDTLMFVGLEGLEMGSLATMRRNEALDSTIISQHRGKGCIAIPGKVSKLQ